MPEASTNIYSDSHLHSQQNQIGKMREREEESHEAGPIRCCITVCTKVKDMSEQFMLRPCTSVYSDPHGQHNQHLMPKPCTNVHSDPHGQSQQNQHLTCLNPAPLCTLIPMARANKPRLDTRVGDYIKSDP
jgi:hypothetical protein